MVKNPPTRPKQITMAIKELTLKNSTCQNVSKCFIHVGFFGVQVTACATLALSSSFFWTTDSQHNKRDWFKHCQLTVSTVNGTGSNPVS